MTKNPFINALCATLYIAVLVSLLQFGPEKLNMPEVLAGLLMISVFVFSAALMAYVVMYQPVLLFFESKHKESVTLFFQTLGFFALNTAVVVGTGLLLFKL